MRGKATSQGRCPCTPLGPRAPDPDYWYATNLTRAAVGFLASNAGEVPEPKCVALFAVGPAAPALVARRRRTG